MTLFFINLEQRKTCNSISCVKRIKKKKKIKPIRGAFIIKPKLFAGPLIIRNLEKKKIKKFGNKNFRKAILRYKLPVITMRGEIHSELMRHNYILEQSLIIKDIVIKSNVFSVLFSNFLSISFLFIVCLSIYLYVHLIIYLSIYLSIFPSTNHPIV